MQNKRTRFQPKSRALPREERKSVHSHISSLFFFFFKHIFYLFVFKYLFIYFWLRQVLVAARRLLSSCGVPCGILVPRPGIEPTSPALEGGFLITGAPGKSLSSLFCLNPLGVLFVCTLLLEGFTGSEQLFPCSHGKRSRLGASPLPLMGECDPQVLPIPFPASGVIQSFILRIVIKHSQNKKGTSVEGSLCAKYCSKRFACINTFTLHGNPE